MSEPLVVAEELEKEYRTGPEVVRVLRGASLVVRPAEIVALVGASGVGKSTLLHVLGALDRPTAGRVRFRGEDLFARGEAGVLGYPRPKGGLVFPFLKPLRGPFPPGKSLIPTLPLQKPPPPARGPGPAGPPP